MVGVAGGSRSINVLFNFYLCFAFICLRRSRRSYETEAMLVFETSAVGVGKFNPFLKYFFHKTFFCSPEIAAGQE